MRFEISHKTSYVYSEGVFLEPHLLRLKPRSDAGQRLLDYRVHVDPSPAGMGRNLDLEGNEVFAVWFQGETTRLNIKTKSVVETVRSNPFDYIWMGQHELPMAYAEELTSPLQIFQAHAAEPAVGAFAEEVALRADRDAQQFLPALVAAVHSHCQQIHREHGEPLPAAETLQRGAGSCRDLAILFMDACRAMNFAARFVSGYHAPLGGEDHEMHAWVEVYVPGGGWRGFDPSVGLAVTDRHIALAGGAAAREAAPVSGSYRGEVKASLETDVTIRELG
jgi:transglutaminase-like putative cysteine protease